MKTALQEADATEGEDGATPVQRDAKGREIISPEEKAKRDEKARKVAAEVRLHCGRGPVDVDRAALCRKRRRGRSACRSSSRICVTSSAFSRRVPLAQPTPTFLNLGGQYALLKLSEFIRTSSLWSHSLTFLPEGTEG